MIGNTLLMLVPMDQGLREAGPLRAVPARFFRMLMVLEGMRSQPEQPRHCGQGKEEESSGESPARHHARIVVHPAGRVKPRRAPPAAGSSGTTRRAGDRRPP